MRPSVQAAWPAFVVFYEGRLTWLYLDTKSLVTTGIGFLMDTGIGQAPEACLRLPWTDQGLPATQTQISAAWDRVKARIDLAPRGGYAFKDVTTLRLPEQAIGALLTAKTLEFWSILLGQLPGLEQWPADAQLALLDMAWHMGPYFLGPRWPNFTAAAHAEDFAGMAAHCQTANRSPRDARHVRLYRNAALVVELGLDPARLWDDLTPEQEEPMAERIPFRGAGLTCECVVKSLPWIEFEMLARGIIKQSIDIYQLGYRDNVEASKGTHAGGGCVDTGQFSAAAIDIWRLWGWPMQDRSPWFEPDHGHGWPYKCPHLSPAAQRQQAAWDQKRNGLVNNELVIGRWPVKPWNEALTERKRLIMAVADEIAAKVIDAVGTKGEIADAVLSRDNQIENTYADTGAGDFVALKTAMGHLGNAKRRVDQTRSLMDQVATKTDLAAVKTQVGQVATKTDLAALSSKLDAAIAAIQKLTPPTPPPA